MNNSKPLGLSRSNRRVVKYKLLHITTNNVKNMQPKQLNIAMATSLAGVMPTQPTSHIFRRGMGSGRRCLELPKWAPAGPSRFRLIYHQADHDGQGRLEVEPGHAQSRWLADDSVKYMVMVDHFFENHPYSG